MSRKEAAELTRITERTEGNAVYNIYSNLSGEVNKDCGARARRIGSGVLTRTDTFPGFSLNHAQGLGITEPLTESIIDEVLEFYSGKPGIFAVQLVPDAKPQSVRRFLEERGFQFKNYWIRFYRECKKAEDGKTELEIRKVGSEYADAFSEIVNIAFTFPEAARKITKGVFRTKDWHNYMAFDKGKPAATGSIFFDGETAWIGYAATLPGARGKGAQGALIVKRINDAAERGCKWIAVETAEDTAEKPNPSYHNMVRYGFKELYKRENWVKTTSEPVR